MKLMTGIFLIQADDQLVEMSEKSYEAESLLQELLAKYPNLLPGDQINNTDPRRWLLISREVALSHEDNNSNKWSVDHLFLDQDAIPTLVEVKRSENTDIRRKVVGQMLDYASNASVYWQVEAIKNLFESTCQKQDLDPDVVLRDFISDSDDPENFWRKVKSNLQDGKIRMLFVADAIPAELRRIVEFLNSQMNRAEVLAIEIKQYTNDNLKSLIPRVIGQTEEAITIKNPATGKQWNEETFFRELESRKGPEDSKIAREIYNWACDKLPRFWWGRGNIDGSFFPILDHKGIGYYPIGVWTYGKVEIQFQRLKTKPPFDDDSKRKELLDRLNQIPNVNIPVNAMNTRPNIFLSVFKDKEVLEQFLHSLDWVVEEIKKS